MTRIRQRRRGPFAVEGDFELVDADGNVIDLAGRKKVLLCRCGASNNMPFCDSSHYRVSFDNDAENGEE